MNHNTSFTHDSHDFINECLSWNFNSTKGNFKFLKDFLREIKSKYLPFNFMHELIHPDPLSQKIGTLERSSWTLNSTSIEGIIWNLWYLNGRRFKVKKKVYPYGEERVKTFIGFRSHHDAYPTLESGGLNISFDAYIANIKLPFNVTWISTNTDFADGERRWWWLFRTLA